MQAKQNLTLALFTSFLVLVLGAAIWGLLYYYGVFSAWVALFASAGASACYLKFYNRKNALYYLWIIILSIGLNFAAQCLSLIIIYQVAYGVPFDVACAAFGDMINENMNGFIINTVFGALFAVFGALWFVLFFRFKKVDKTPEKQPLPQPATVEKIGEEYVKIADFCLKNFVQFVKIQDKSVREQKIGEFQQKYLSRFNAQIKENVIKALQQKSLSGEEMVAVELLKTCMK